MNKPKIPTMREYIENSLFHHPSLYKNRMDVLSQLFTTLGNGIELHDGFLLHSKIPVEEIKEDKRLFLAKSTQQVLKSIGRTSTIEEIMNDERYKREIETGLNYKNNYNAPCNNFHLYPWTDTEDFYVFKDYVGCLNEGFAEEIGFFYEQVKNFDLDLILKEKEIERVKNHFLFNEEEFDRKYENMKKWKENIDILFDYFPNEFKMYTAKKNVIKF